MLAYLVLSPVAIIALLFILGSIFLYGTFLIIKYESGWKQLAWIVLSLMLPVITSLFYIAIYFIRIRPQSATS